MRRLSSLALLAAVGTGLAACTSEVAGSWVPQDVDVGDTLDGLGNKAYSLICDQFSSYVHELYSSQLLVKAACTAHALRTTTDTNECTKVANACLETLPSPVDSELQSILEQASCERSDVLPSGCRAPVAELVACLEDLRGAIERLELSATCAAFGSRVPPEWWRIARPASCIELATRCRPRL
jgi:hypothetical protein